MNQDQNETRNDLNADGFEYTKPVVIFISFFMFVGIVGNSLTLYIYLFRMKSSTLQILIIHLGFVDMLGCCLSVPLSMVDLILPFMYPSDFLCKIQYFILYYTCIASSFSLLVIAVERFNRVCRPLARQISTFYSKRIVVGVSLFSFLISIPPCLLFQRKEIHFLNGYTCYADVSLFFKIFFNIVRMIFWLCLIIMFILYFLIWRKTRQHFRHLYAQRNKKPKDDSDNLNEETTRISFKVNLAIFSLMTLFFVSYSPMFIFTFVTSVRIENNFTVILIASHLWVLNCSLNPVVYGIFNGKFRRECKRLFSKEMNQ